ncbi:MAG: carboxypeptidase M32 [Bacteroidetes bacterium]|nr:carboxypeptidase M32 [Bacteroidota bacterium]MCY4205386.1 carboxypeptidase M32 [Bacteroidota bacterium]
MSSTKKSDFEELLEIVRKVCDLRAAASMLEWDQETYMPRGAGEARARQLSTLYSTSHEIFIRDRTGELIERLRGEECDPMGFQESLVRVTERDFSRACKLSPEMVGKIAETTSNAKAAWVEAFNENDFGKFSGDLSKVIGLCIEKAEAIGYSEHPYDALLDEYEPGATSGQISRVFDDLRASLVPIVQAIEYAPQPVHDFLQLSYDSDIQWDFGMEVLRDIGFDFRRGRQDISTHPFSTAFSTNDVRITTRIHDRHVVSGLFSSLHEAGHGMYEQGINPMLEGTFLAQGTSLGIHESQSRLWENQVGRSKAFWTCYYRDLQQRFKKQLGEISREKFYQAINCVAASPVRVDADEVTYNLHIMLRFELEMMLIDEEISVHELPELWTDRMRKYLGVQPENDTKGVLQDIHWALGAIGYFPTYTLGNLMSAQIFSCAKTALIDLDDQIARGEFAPLRDWLQTNVYHWGRMLSATEIIEWLTKGPISADPWLHYIRQKYSAIYGDLP